MERSPIVGDVRGLGLLMAIEIVADQQSKRAFPPELNVSAMLTEQGLKHGIALYDRRANRGAYGDMQLITPPLVSTEAEIDEMVKLFGQSLADLEAELACIIQRASGLHIEKLVARRSMSDLVTMIAAPRPSSIKQRMIGISCRRCRNIFAALVDSFCQPLSFFATITVKRVQTGRS